MKNKRRKDIPEYKDLKSLFTCIRRYYYSLEWENRKKGLTDHGYSATMAENMKGMVVYFPDVPAVKESSSYY
jgi:hypothetical protein